MNSQIAQVPASRWQRGELNFYLAKEISRYTWAKFLHNQNKMTEIAKDAAIYINGTGKDALFYVPTKDTATLEYLAMGRILDSGAERLLKDGWKSIFKLIGGAFTSILGFFRHQHALHDFGRAAKAGFKHLVPKPDEFAPFLHPMRNELIGILLSAAGILMIISLAYSQFGELAQATRNAKAEIRKQLGGSDSGQSERKSMP